MESQPSNNSIVKINNNNHNHNNNTNTNNTNINHTSNNQTQTVATQQQQQPQQNNNVVAPAPSFTPTSNNNQNVNIALQSQQQQHNNNVIAPTPVFTPTPIAGVSGGPAAVPAPTPATAAAHPMYSAAMHSSNLYMPAAGVPQPASVYPMIPTHIPSNVYVNNVTANVNLHGWPHTVPAYIQGAAPHYIHSEVSPDQNGPVMQALPVSLAPTNAIVGPGNSNSTGPANMSARGSRRGRGRGGSGGSRRGDYNNQRHPPPEGSPVPQQAQQNQDQMLQSMGQQQQQPSQQMDAQLMAGGPHAYAPHPQYAHASPYPYAAAYPTFFATQNPMIHAAQATAQQAANTPLYVPMFANAHQLYSYVGGSFMYSPVMNPPEYHQFMPGDDGQGDERHNPEGMMSQMWHTQQVYSEEYGMNPEMHSAGGDELNQSVASSETPSMLSPNYPIYGQQLHEMQHQMGVMQIFDEPQMGQMQSMHTGTAVTQIEDDLVECGGQPGTIQMVPAGALIAAGPMQMPGDTQLIHHGHVQHPAPPHHMMQIAMEPQMPAVQPQQHQHGGGAENVNIDNGNNNNNAQNNEVTNLHAVDSMASLNEVGQQSTENIAQDYQLQQQQQQQSQQQHEQPMQQHQQPTAVEFNEVYSNNHLHMTDGGGELIDYVPNSEELALAPAAVATGVPTQQQQMQTSPPLQKYPQQQRHEQQQVQHQHQQKSQQPMQQPYNRHEQQPQQLNQHQSQAHQQTQQPHQQHHSQQQQQQQHQPNYHPHQQHQPYEQRRQPQVYNTQSRRKYTSDNSNNNSNAYQQHQPHVPNNNSNTNSDSSSQTTRSMWWTNSSQHKKSTASVAVTATPTTNTNNNNANMSGANKQSSSYSHLTKTFTNQQHHFHQQQNYHPHQHHQPQMRNHSVMKTPTSPVSVAAPPLSNTNAAANSTANLATSTIATATVTVERQNSQGDQVKANYVSNNNVKNSNSNAINNIGSGNTNSNTTTPAATSTASTTAAPHQFPVQAQQQHPQQSQQQQRQQQTTALVDKQYPGFTSSKKTAAASATTTSANGSNAPLAMNLAPPASTATVATSSPAGGSWASLFNKSNSNNAAASAAPAANSTQSTSSNNSNNNNNSISNIGISSNSPALPASKPIAMVAPYECSIPVIPTPPIVTPGGMSYSAASAQGITPPAATVAPKATKTESTIRVLPAAAAAVRNNANLDEYTLKFSEFLTKAKTDLSPISLRPRGLTNPSNYCYINSILQALLGCAPFYNLMRSIPKQAAALSEVKTPTVNAMISFFSNFSALPSGLRLRANKGPKGKDELGSDLQCDFAFEPNEIYRLWIDSRKEYVEGRQEDAEEFLGYVLNKLNDEMLEIIKLIAKPNAEQNGQNDQSENEDGDEWQMICNNRNKGSVTRQTDFGRTPLSDIFRGELRSRLQREGEHSTDDIQPFFTLQLNIEKAASVKEALEILVGRDQLEGVTGSKSKQEVVAWQQMTLEKLPIILILHLKWFDYRSDGCTKILKKVEFPVELKIDAKILASKKYSQKQRTYRLFAVVYHEGKEATKGHYITDVYHTGYSSWLRYNDSAVKPVSENEVLYPKTPRVPYLLYYRRCDTVPQQAASATGGNSGSYMNPSNHSGK